MRVRSFENITKGDIPDLDDETWKLGIPVVRQLVSLTQAVQGRLGFTDNMLSETRTLKFDDDTSLTIKLRRLKTIPIAVVLLKEALFDYWQLAWAVVDKTSVKVKIRWDSSPSTPTEATILIIGN